MNKEIDTGRERIKNEQYFRGEKMGGERKKRGNTNERRKLGIDEVKLWRISGKKRTEGKEKKGNNK